MAHVLAVGIATLDIINEVDRYPHEDAEVRALAHTIRRGGNATNTLVVLSQLGHACAWAGVLGGSREAEVVLEDLARYRIETRYCQRLAAGMMPTSYITLSRRNGSRTIVHYRDLPEYSSTAFSAIELEPFDWVHFEGRNVEETQAMMHAVRERGSTAPVSLEVEKPRPGIERLFGLADLIVFSADYARATAGSAQQLLRQVRVQAPGAKLVCTLGTEGALGLEARGDALLRVEAVRPARVVDTLGAGDTFNAGLVHTLLGGAGLDEALHFAARLAGGKCGQQGLDNLDLAQRSGGHI